MDNNSMIQMASPMGDNVMLHLFRQVEDARVQRQLAVKGRNELYEQDDFCDTEDYGKSLNDAVDLAWRAYERAHREYVIAAVKTIGMRRND